MKRILVGLSLCLSLTIAAARVWVSPRATFTPLSLSSLRAWGDCSDGSKVTLSGSNITQVTDKSTNAYTWVQATAADQPLQQTNALNGYSSCRFAASDKLAGSTGADLTTGTVCALVNFSALAQFDTVIGASAVPTGQLTLEVGGSNNRMDLWIGNVASAAATGAASITTGTWYRMCAWTDASSIGIYLNAVSASSAVSANRFFKMGNSALGLTAGFTAMRGDLMEWIFTTTVSPTDITNIDNYWKSRYGL